MPDCTPCAHAAEHGWWGKTLPAGQTHCRDCHASWPGGNKWGHCSACHRTFAGISAFDAHQSVTKSGIPGPQSLCLVSDTGLPEESTDGAPRKFYQAYKGFNLTQDRAPWGVFWRRREQFTGGST